MIKLRRGLIDKATKILPTSDLFSANAIYPRRYFDDLMVYQGIEKKMELEHLRSEMVSKQALLSPVGPMSQNSKNIDNFLNTNSSKMLGNVPSLPFALGNTHSKFDNFNKINV
jgi:hypothetical protein